MQQHPAQFGPIPGVPLFKHFEDRRQLYLAGVHGVLEGGIYGRAGTGAYSVVLSGRYADDEDEGNVIWYTGAGGYSRASEKQFKDQEWKRGNEALRHSQRIGNKVRVIRSSGLNSEYAPIDKGYRYDGLYTVEEAQMVIGKSGHEVCQFRLVRVHGQDPIPINGIRIHSGSSNADAAASANSSRTVGDISAQCLPGGGMHLVPLGRPRPNSRPHTAGPSRAPAAAVQKERQMPSRRATVGPGGASFKYEGRDSPSGPMQRNGGVFRPPSPDPPGFR